MASLHKEGNPEIDQHKSCSQSDVNYFNDETVERVYCLASSPFIFLKYFLFRKKKKKRKNSFWPVHKLWIF